MIELTKKISAIIQGIRLQYLKKNNNNNSNNNNNNNVYVLDWEDQLAANQQMNQHLSHSYITKPIESIAWRHDQCTK